jgi:hypothetical protein
MHLPWFNSPRDRLRDTEVSEEIAQLLGVHSFQQPGWHQAAADRLLGFDLGFAERDIFALEPAQDDDLRFRSVAIVT